jgi:ActR/RegA family two-component response regulator
VRRRFSAISVLLATGYSSSAQHAVSQGFNVLQKPYDLPALARALRAARKGADRAPQRAAG